MAVIRFDDGVPVRFEIRDYCQTGVFVAFVEKKTPDGAMLSLVGTPTRMEFSLGEGTTSSSFQFEGRVVHVTANGMGVYVPAMPEEVLQALSRAGERLAPSEPAPGEPAVPRQQFQALQQECTSLFRGFLDGVLQDFFQRGPKRLREAASEETSFMERSRYAYGADELVQRWPNIQEDFFNVIRDRIHHSGPKPETPSAVSAAGEMALVDEAEFEDWLNLSAVIDQIEADLVTDLKGFERRYGQLSGTFIDRKNNPFGPEAICLSFQGAIQAMDLTNPMRTVLYKAFGHAVSQHAAEFYRALNQALAPLCSSLSSPPSADQREQAVAAPVQAPAEERLPTEPAAPEGSTTKADLAEIAEALTRLYKQGQIDPSQAPEEAEYSLDRILASLSQSQGGAAARPVSEPAVKQTGAASAPAHAAVGWPDILGMVERMRETTRQLPGGQAVQGQVAPGALDKGVLPEASLRELLMALDVVPLAVQSGPGGAPGPAVAEQIDAQLALAAGGGRRLAPDYRQTLDSAAHLFRQARAEFVQSSEVESLVKRLERTLLKLALRDESFPTNPDHPARQLINLIDQFTLATDDKGKFFDAKLQRFLYLLVDRINSRAEEDPGVFVTVRDSLEKVLQPIRKARRMRVARMQEACEGRELIRLARTRVNEALEQRLAGRKVPGILPRLLDVGWRQYLTLLAMRHGNQGEAWGAGMVVLDRLSAWLSPADEADSGEVATPEALLNEIESQLLTVNVEAGQVTAFMNELGAMLHADKAGTLQALPMVSIPPGKLAMPRPEEGEEQATTPGDLAGQIRMGDWWDFTMEGNRVPMQLIWLNQAASLCTFANRSATNKLELSLADLAKQGAAGLARPGKDLDLPLLERSENSLFDETYQQLMRQALHDPVTDLLNRKGFMQRLHSLGMSAQRDTVHTVGIIEFDQFRTVLNTCGVEAAQRLSRELAGRIADEIGRHGVLAAFREDNLALLLPDCSRGGECHTLDSLMNQVRNHHFQHEDHSFSIGLNIGMAEYAPVSMSGEEAVRRADAACIAAKSMGRNSLQVYEEASAALKTQESLMEWAGRIDALLEGGGLYLRCQMVMPIGLDTTLQPYYEILLGIRGQPGTEIRPMDFIPAVERLQRSHEVDLWVIQKVFEWIRSNPSGFESAGGFAINLSARSLGNPDVMAFIQHVLPRSGVPGEKIMFEITETAAVESYGAAQAFIQKIRRYGSKVSLDDFGSGFTSYAHLKNLCADTLKIDGSYVKDMLQNPNDLAMVKSMNDIAHSLGLRTVAEYVESPMVLSKLREIGVDYAQGYLIHKPCPIDEILLRQG